MAEGHKTVIRDFGTVGLVDRLFPEEERTAAQEMSERFLEGVPLNALRTLHMLWQLRSIDRAFQSRQTACCEELARKLAETPGIDFIALKINHQDDLPSAILLAKRIRHHAANRCLAAFGRIADFYGRQLVNTTTAFDCVCVGDPELGITALADHIHHRESWPTLPNLILPGTDRPCHTQREYVQDLNALPDPVYDAEIYRALRNNRKLKLFPIEESRGCDQSCNHCPKPGEEGGLRLRSPLRVTAHMRRIAASHGVGSFHLIGGGAPAAHAADVAHAFHESGIRTAYSRESSLLAAETAHLPLLKRSGCVSISYGIGSGSQRLLRDYFNLDTGVTRIENLLRGCREAGLVTVARFMYPTPADDHHTGAETLRLLERTRPDAVIFNQFDQLPNSLWHYNVTGPAMAEVFHQIARPGDVLAGAVLSSGSAGTMAAGSYLRDTFPGAKVGVAEALQCPTILENGFGDHRIEGIGDKHIPWIHNLRETDAAIGVDDELPIRFIRLFNEPAGQKLLAENGVGQDVLDKLEWMGISCIGNMIGAIKFAKYYELGENDVVFTVFTDSMAMYQSRLTELNTERGVYDQRQADRDYDRLSGISLDYVMELSHVDKRRVHQLKYFSWVEQLGKTVEELRAQWDDYRNYWGCLRTQSVDLDKMIDEFNAEVQSG